MTQADSYSLLLRIQQMKDRSEKPIATINQHVKFFLHLAMSFEPLLYPQCEPLIELMQCVAPQISELRFECEETYPIRCSSCGSLQGYCNITPVRVTCCITRFRGIGDYFLDRISAAFEFDMAQRKQLSILYNQCLGEYHATRNASSNTSLTSNNPSGN